MIRLSTLTPAVSASLLGAVMSGCVLLRPTDPFEGAGPRETADAATAPAADREAESRSPVPDELTLEAAVGIALTNNPGVAALRHETDAADALHAIARGRAMPHAAARASLYQYREDQIINPRRPGTVDTILFSDRQLGGDLILGMPLYTGGRLISGIRAARLMREASASQLAHSREELVFNVSSVYYAILAQKHTVHSLEFSRTVLTEHLKRVGEMIRSQKAAKVDQLRVEVRLADLEQRLAAENNILAIHQRVLFNLLGLREEPAAPPALAGSFAESDDALPDMDAAVAGALGRRHDYRKARLALDAQARRVDAARAGRAPVVALDAAVGNRWDAHDTGRDNEIGSAGVTVSLPLFEGGMITAEIRRERAVLRALQEKLREKEYQVRLQVESALLNIASSRERVRASGKSIEQATESLRIEQEKYGYAKGSITDVLDAQSDLLNAQMTHYRARADHSTALAHYRFAAALPH